MSIFRRPTDPTEAVLRRLSKRLRWEIKHADLRFLARSTRQYIDESLAVGLADRLRFELATGQGV